MNAGIAGGGEPPGISVARDAGPPSRAEVDSLGAVDVPAEAYYGVHTLRAVHNFPISGIPVSSHPEFVCALAAVKQAAAVANQELGLLDRQRADAIVTACEEIRDGALHQQFVVDVVQGGAGTSTNMNANEVIANRALELLGRAKGEYQHLHPLDHVNLSQSTNDCYPTAIKVALQVQLTAMSGSLGDLVISFREKAGEFAGVIKMGRTQLQEAVPMTLGQEFSTYAVTLAEDIQLLNSTRELIAEINLGGTAIGTGLNAPRGYRDLVCRELSAITGLALRSAHDLIEATQDVGAFIAVSGVLKRTALKLSKICNDLRLLSSGPQAGLAEINLPAVQAGSSIMPGKVNPVIPEVVNQVAFQVVGNDMAIAMAADAGQLQLNAFEPVIAHSLFTSVRHLDAACRTLADNCVRGITANSDRMYDTVLNSVGVVTALAPVLGYAESVRIAKLAMSSGRRVQSLVTEANLLPPQVADALLRPEAFVVPDPAWGSAVRK